VSEYRNGCVELRKNTFVRCGSTFAQQRRKRFHGDELQAVVTEMPGLSATSATLTPSILPRTGEANLAGWSVNLRSGYPVIEDLTGA
jgi:hypothetical protein